MKKEIYIKYERLDTVTTENIFGLIEKEFFPDYTDRNYSSEQQFIEIYSEDQGYEPCAISIDIMLNLLNNLKLKNATHVFIGYDEDHSEYELIPYIIRHCTSKEIDDYNESESTRLEKQKRISLLEKEIRMIKGTL